VLEPSGSPRHGFCANDGRPFPRLDFQALSNLGQSSKDPTRRSEQGASASARHSKCQRRQRLLLPDSEPPASRWILLPVRPGCALVFEKVITAVLAGDDEPRWRHDGFDSLVGGVRGEAFRGTGTPPASIRGRAASAVAVFASGPNGTDRLGCPRVRASRLRTWSVCRFRTRRHVRKSSIPGVTFGRGDSVPRARRGKPHNPYIRRFATTAGRDQSVRYARAPAVAIEVSRVPRAPRTF